MTGAPLTGPAADAGSPTGTEAAALAALLAGGGVVVLSGAGLSTESGIPDYRGPDGSLRRNTPMTYQEFTGSLEGRRRYWARSFVGWRRIAAARPNAGHRAVAALQRRGVLDGVITQNVDGLHQAAGTDGVVELHGGLDRVVCLTCGERTARADLDRRLSAANPDWPPREPRATAHPDAVGRTDDAGRVNADGDAELPDDVVAAFRVVGCGSCGGVLKPDVVFFGETVDPAVVAASTELVARSRGVLVLGSSLTVLSGRRFVVQAARQGLPVAIVNQGTTRGDRYATVRVDGPLGPTLTGLAAALDAALPTA